MTRSTAVVNEITLVRSAVFKEALENKPGESDSKPNRSHGRGPRPPGLLSKCR